jgi:hypothetical protein
MEIDLRRGGGARKTLTEEEEDVNGGMITDPVYEEIERNAISGCGGGDLCPCGNNGQQRGPAVMHYQQASDLSDEERRQNSSDVSRQSSRSYGDNRPLIPTMHHHHHNHQHQLSTQSQPGSSPHDLLTTISCAFNSPHLRTKHRHPQQQQQGQQQFDPAMMPIHMGFEGAPHFEADRYGPPRIAYHQPYPLDHGEALTAVSLMNGERIFVASGAIDQQQQPQRSVPFTEC